MSCCCPACAGRCACSGDAVEWAASPTTNPVRRGACSKAVPTVCVPCEDATRTSSLSSLARFHPHTRAYARGSALIASGVVIRRHHLPPTPSSRHAPEEFHARRPLRRSFRLVPRRIRAAPLLGWIRVDAARRADGAARRSADARSERGRDGGRRGVAAGRRCSARAGRRGRAPQGDARRRGRAGEGRARRGGGAAACHEARAARGGHASEGGGARGGGSGEERPRGGGDRRDAGTPRDRLPSRRRSPRRLLPP
ncbi:hypothetical protein ACAE71_01942 [Clavibacter nebraskensis]